MLMIDKMLTLSLSHLTSATEKLLHNEPDTNSLGLTVYEMNAGGENLGMFVYIKPKMTTEDMPRDLSNCIQLANDLDCTILCFDQEGPSIPYLAKYTI